MTLDVVQRKMGARSQGAPLQMQEAAVQHLVVGATSQPRSES